MGYARVRSIGWVIVCSALISTGCGTPLRRPIAGGAAPRSFAPSDQAVARASAPGLAQVDETVSNKKKAPPADGLPGAAPAESARVSAAPTPQPPPPWTVTTITHKAPPVATSGSAPADGRTRPLAVLRRIFIWLFVPALAVLAGLVVILALSSSKREIHG